MLMPMNCKNYGTKPKEVKLLQKFNKYNLM